VLASSETMEGMIRDLRPEILAFLRRRTSENAEELCQDVWLRIAKASPALKEPQAYRAYAFTVARRVLVDAHRRKAARVSLVLLPGGLEDERTTESPYSHACAQEILGVVEQTLRSIKPELAEVFRLRTRTRLSFRAIAERQGVSLNTALGRMHQAVHRLRDALLGAGWLEEE
jgi:RNA polymerase sigma-70 factor (ECF subfamily)